MRLFVTGTDTDVGKTMVTASLAMAARAFGTVVACKPVASGAQRGTPGDDALRLADASGTAPCTCFSFEAPVSPHRAAMLESRAVDDSVLTHVRGLRADTVLIEGVGGWEVPLRVDPTLWVRDMALAAAADVLVVAADRLGVLNHTLLTVDAVRRSGLRVRAVVLNEVQPTRDVSSAYNLEDLRRLCDVPVAPFPRLPADDRAAMGAAGADLLRAIL